jgi:ABC-type branched-subunit amino acid transport system ATPase component
VPDTVLEVRDLTISYRGGGIGVAGVSFSVEDATVVTLLGPNGAGKTSSLRGVGGVMRGEPAMISGGKVIFRGDEITRIGPRERAKRGIAVVPESDKVFAKLSVKENLEVSGSVAGRRAATFYDQSLEVFPELVKHLQRPAGYLSGGQRQMLGLAMALCSGPKLLVVDELTLGLSPALIPTLVDSIKQLVARGLPVVMAEQNPRAALELSRDICMLDSGRMVDFGRVSEVMTREEKRMMLVRGQVT